jgi:hypothetical protein
LRSRSIGEFLSKKARARPIINIILDSALASAKQRSKATEIIMPDTRLVLIEGLPGAGKTTTTCYLRDLLQYKGMECRQYREEDRPHPIDLCDFEIEGLPEKTYPLWANFVKNALCEPTITIIESRLWQNTALFMYMSECSIKEITGFVREVGQLLLPLDPVLIYLDQDETESALARLYPCRGKYG